MKTRNDWLCWSFLAVFALFGVLRHLGDIGDDLAPSYVACRLLAAHQPAHLFSRDPANYNAVSDPLWTSFSRGIPPRPDNPIHPYVQTPLWALSLTSSAPASATPPSMPAFSSLSALPWSPSSAWLRARLDPAAVSTRMDRSALPLSLSLASL